MKSQTAMLSLTALGILAGTASTVSTNRLGESRVTETRVAVTQTVVADLPDLPDHLCGPGVSACFLPGTPGHIINRVNDGITRRWLKEHQQGGIAFNADARWSGTNQGDPLELAWSVVPDGLFIPNALGEGGGSSNLRARMVTMFGSLENGLDKIRLMFDRWEELTGITYTEVSDDGASWGAGGPHNGSNGRGDVRLSMKNFSNQFFGVLAYNFFPDNGDMVLNSDHTGDFDNSFGNFRFFRNTIAHEHGHGMGLSHVCPANQTKLLEPFISTAYDGPMLDDRRGGQRSYGDRFEANNSFVTAASLGSVDNGIFDHNSLSLDDNADFDYFSFTVDPGKQATIRVTPFGWSYPDWDQNQFTGQCLNSGPTVNALTIHDLVLQLRDTDGLTILEQQNSTSFGSAEEIVEYILPSGGTFFIRVHPNDTTNDVQIYDLRLSIADAPSEAEFAPIADVDVPWGTLNSGGIAELTDSDDTRMRIQSQRGFSAIEPNLNEIVVGFTSPHSSVSELNLMIEGRVDGPLGVAKIRMKNFNNGTTPTIAEFSMPQAETLFEFLDLNNPNRFVDDDNDDRIEVYVKNVMVATFTPLGFESLYDWVAVSVKPQ